MGEYHVRIDPASKFLSIESNFNISGPRQVDENDTKARIC